MQDLCMRMLHLMNLPIQSWITILTHSNIQIHSKRKANRTELQYDNYRILRNMS